MNNYTVCIVSKYLNIGQMSKKSSIEHCERMLKQTGKKWIAVQADYLYCPDQSFDNDTFNPCPQAACCWWVVQEDSYYITNWTMENLKNHGLYK